jgi:hypothetical protein
MLSVTHEGAAVSLFLRATQMDDFWRYASIFWSCPGLNQVEIGDVLGCVHVFALGL